MNIKISHVAPAIFSVLLAAHSPLALAAILSSATIWTIFATHHCSPYLYKHRNRHFKPSTLNTAPSLFMIFSVLYSITLASFKLYLNFGLFGSIGFLAILQSFSVGPLLTAIVFGLPCLSIIIASLAATALIQLAFCAIHAGFAFTLLASASHAQFGATVSIGLVNAVPAYAFIKDTISFITQKDVFRFKYSPHPSEALVPVYNASSPPVAS